MTDIADVLGKYVSRYAAVLQSADSASPEYFAMAWKVASAEISPTRLQDEFKITESTIEGYKRGTKLPAPTAQPIILERLVKLLESASK